jgi:uncharacterized membrane protein YoaK (UPF0700 family)
MTDLASFTQLGGLFSSVMTGNLVVLGLAAARAVGELDARTAAAFAGCIAAVALGSCIGRRARRDDVAWPAAVTDTLLVDLLPFAGLTVGWELTGSRPAGAWQLVLLGVAALAMGLQSAAVALSIRRCPPRG